MRLEKKQENADGIWEHRWGWVQRLWAVAGEGVTSWLLGTQVVFSCFFLFFGNKLMTFEKGMPKWPKGSKITSCTSGWWPGDVISCVVIWTMSIFSSCFHSTRAEGVGVFILPLVPGVGVGAHSRCSGSVWWMNKRRHAPRSWFRCHADPEIGLLCTVPGEAWSPVLGEPSWVRAPPRLLWAAWGGRDCKQRVSGGIKRRALKDF